MSHFRDDALRKNLGGIELRKTSIDGAFQV